MPTRSFDEVIADLRRGGFVDDCDDKLRACIAAVEDIGKSAVMNIKLTIKPGGRVGGTVVITDDISIKLPAQPAGETIMFVTPELNLIVNDPRQSSLDLKTVPDSKPTLKQVA